MPVTALATMQTALAPTRKKKPAAKKPAAKKKKKKPAKKAAAKKAIGAPAPTDAMLDRVVDLIDHLNDACMDLDDAAAADTVGEYNAAVVEASKKLAATMKAMAALAAKIDPGAYAAAAAQPTALAPRALRLAQ